MQAEPPRIIKDLNEKKIFELEMIKLLLKKKQLSRTKINFTSINDN